MATLETATGHVPTAVAPATCAATLAPFAMRG